MFWCSDSEDKGKSPQDLDCPTRSNTIGLSRSPHPLWVTAFGGAWAGPMGTVVSGQALFGAQLLGETSATSAPWAALWEGLS